MSKHSQQTSKIFALEGFTPYPFRICSGPKCKERPRRQSEFTPGSCFCKTCHDKAMADFVEVPVVETAEDALMSVAISAGQTS